MPVFKTGAINHSATSPQLLQFYYSLGGSRRHSALGVGEGVHEFLFERRLRPAPNSGSLRGNGVRLVDDSFRILGRGETCAAALERLIVRQEMYDRAESARGGFQFVNFQGKFR
jgi:hypothetical protein